MKKITTTILVILGLSAGASASTVCVEAIDNTPVETNMIQPTSQKMVITTHADASVEEDLVVTSHITTFKGSPSDVEVDFNEVEVGVLY